MKFFIYFDENEHSFTLIDENTSEKSKIVLIGKSTLIDTFDSDYQNVQHLYQNKTSQFYKNYLKENPQ